jgi:hypothetical protein
MSTIADLKGKKILRLSTDPMLPNTGDIWLNTTDRKLKTYNGTAVKSFDITKQSNVPELTVTNSSGSDVSMLDTNCKEAFVTTLDTDLPYTIFDVTEGEISGGL